MPSYDQKLAAFTEGKSLIRLPRPIRDRADASCDACGSNHPRTLYGLKESASNRHYFVGNTCLKELVKLGVILRRFGRESGQAAYENEMELRSASKAEQGVKDSVNGKKPDAPRAAVEPKNLGASAGDPNGDHVLIPSVLILESLEHYQAVVSFISARGVAYGWGSALEPRYTKHWRQGGDRGLVLEEVKEENPFASRRCLTSAWYEAISHLDASSGLSAALDEIGRDHLESIFGGPLLTLLRLDSTCAASADFSPGFRMVCQSHLQSLASLGSSR